VGTNFSVFSEAADRVELCLFDDHGRESRIDLPETSAFIHHGYANGVGPGQRYGFRVHGQWAPGQGLWANPAKLLLDPYGKAVDGMVRYDRNAVYPYRAGDESRASTADSARSMPRSVVASPFFDWGNDRPPDTPWHRTVVYELHVKGFTRLHPRVPPELRGTYAGLAQPEVVEYLVGLGITAVELQPVHQFVHDQFLLDRGLRNYWGYNSICYLAPHNEYSASGAVGEQVQEFKQLVKVLHQAGIEVILDVVYNHTAEGNHLGPMLSYKGLDNEAYYRLVPEDRRYYMDYTGTGNTLNMRHPHVLQLVMDSLRYWVLDMHVDGFRFDLAATLARTQDPVISQVKLIAEPWDVGEGGYQVGNFPPLWSEWNGRYRDTVRDYWRGEDATLAEFASRLTGSSDLYEATGRRPSASVNFVTSHDGFTLRDLVSYNTKHNEANDEDNRDGESHNRSWNCGVEGPTDDPAVNARRARQQRNFLTTLLLSQGVPMLLAGDEMGRTQLGNNNAYCQDGELSWMRWDDADEPLLDFTRRLLALRAEHPVFRRHGWFQGREIHGPRVGDIAWFQPEGDEMADADWNVTFAKTLALFLNGEELPHRGPRGEVLRDSSFYLLFNAHDAPIDFVLPDARWGKEWRRMLDTGADGFVVPETNGHPAARTSEPLGPRAVLTAAARSLVVLERTAPT